MDSKEVLTLIQLALGKASVAFMSQPDGGKIVMPTEELLETANELCEAIMAMARKDYARIAELDGAARADEQRLRGAAECAGVGWFGCDTPEVLADTIGALRVDLAAALARAEEAERKFAAIDEYEIVNAMQGPLWDAISKFTMACGGDTSRYVYGNTPRMNAVGEVNAVIRAALRQAMGVRGDD